MNPPPILLSRSDYLRLFNERVFNPPGDRTPPAEEAFAEEFDEALAVVRNFLEAEFPDPPVDEDFVFHLHESYNWSRVIDVVFTTHAFLEEARIERLRQRLAALDKSWTVIMTFLGSVFVSRECVQLFVEDLEPEEEAIVSWAFYCPVR